MKLADHRNGHAHITVARGGYTILGCWFPLEGEYRIRFPEDCSEVYLYSRDRPDLVGGDQQVRVVLGSAPEWGLPHGYYTLVAWNHNGKTQDLDIYEATEEEIEYLNDERIWEDVTPRG